MLFRAFVPNIVNCLEDADGDVRQKAQATIIRLFRSVLPNAYLKAIADLSSIANLG